MLSNLLSRLRKKHVIIIALISLVYVLAAANLTSRRAPWNDEGWFADPAYTLLTKGYMGSPIIHPRGTWLNRELQGIQTHTYWIMPAYPVLQTACYRIFGFGLFQMRAISIFAGFVVIWSWSLLIWTLTKNRFAAWITAAVLAADLTFLYGASDGRMDMTTAAFGSFGLAMFCWLRNNNLSLALLTANTLIAASIFCHPNGVLYALILSLFVARYDLRSLRWRHLLCLFPYLVFAGAWAVYILQKPDDFLAQFRANMEPPGTTRMAGLLHPQTMMLQEITWRYLQHFGGISLWAHLPPLMRIVPFFYWGCLLWLLLEGIVKRNQPHVFVGVCTVAMFSFMSILLALKSPFYLVAILPLYAASVALTISPQPDTFRRIPISLFTIVAVAQGFCFCQAVQHDQYRDGYLPAIAYLKKHASTETLINGSPGLLFALPGYRLISDSRLQEPAEYIVVDRWSHFDWNFVYRNYEPQTAAEIQQTLATYEPAFEQNGWAILHRRIEITNF